MGKEALLGWSGDLSGEWDEVVQEDGSRALFPVGWDGKESLVTEVGLGEYKVRVVHPLGMSAQEAKDAAFVAGVERLRYLVEGMKQ